MEKTQIQFPRYFINKYRHEALPVMEAYVNNNIDDFIDGEEITVRYRGLDGKIRSVNAVVNIEGRTATLSVEIEESDTLKIIESGGTEGIANKNALWLSDNWDDDVAAVYPASDLRTTVRMMVSELRTMREELALCKEALTNTLGGGDIIINSTKHLLENEYDTEAPEDAPQIYATGDTEIYKWDVYIGTGTLDVYSEGGLYKEQRYYPKVRAFNAAGEEIEITSAITVEMSCTSSSAQVTMTGKTLYAAASGDATFRATINDPEHSFSDDKTYLIIFEENEKPDYTTYNVKHLIHKHVDSEEILFANADYLLVGEFCWCIKEQSLYLKEKAANGTIQLFKINGQGSGPTPPTPTGETEEITYVVTDGGVLMADATQGSINITEDGILTLIGTLDENGVLWLDDVESGGTTPTGETEIITARVTNDGILEITIPGSVNPVDSEGILSIVAGMESDGTLDIDDTYQQT